IFSPPQPPHTAISPCLVVSDFVKCRVYIGGADGLTASLYTPSGVCVDSTVCSAATRLEAPLPGIYILCVGNRTFKTILK
ncbi:MAG: hypothetical protein K2I19_02280, partial [Muribaculaceae bacterium]|nr:hypothetical protein [Muribaculaceae bacterium]